MDCNVGTKVIMKKTHPCGNDIFTVLRVGLDYKFRCDGCGHEIMVSRIKAEKMIKKVLVLENKEK